MRPSLNVLAIDGGGIRGLIPAMVLAEIERRTRRPAAGLFDLIAGTSTGGILSLALTVPEPSASVPDPGPDASARTATDPSRPAAPTPRYSAAEIARVYEGEGPRIFSRSLWHRLTAMGNLLDQKYPARGLEAVLEEIFGPVRLHEAIVPVIIAAYELEGRFPFFFKSRKARRDPAYDFPMRVVARATAAAPTYFEPLSVPATDRSVPWGLVDGGMYANNPAMCAYAEALHTDGDRGRPIRVVSLGTGELTRPISASAARDWGVARWAGPLLDVIFDGVSDTVDYQLRQILPEDRYFRFQTELTWGSDDLDDASPENLDRLRRHGTELLERRGKRLDELCDLLRREAARPEPALTSGEPPEGTLSAEELPEPLAGRDPAPDGRREPLQGPDSAPT